MTSSLLNRRTVLSTSLGGAIAFGFGHTISGGAATTKNEPRLRKSIASMTGKELDVLYGAIREMMERSKKNPSDPKGWIANAEPHRNFCAGLGAGGAQQIHYCYWFLPWHRAYLSVTERKLREIAGDQSLTLPYWNWTVQRTIPKQYADKNSPLSNAKRFTEPRPLEDDEVDFIRDEPSIGVGALNAKKFVAMASMDSFKMGLELSNSLGGVVRPNAVDRYAMTRFERSPHGPVHVYVGGVSSDGSDVGDMTDFATAARDPLFFAHHGNLDRLWEIWRQSPSNRASEPNDEAFLKRRFVFPWIDGSPIEVSVKDTLDASVLGYGYDSLLVIPPSEPVEPVPEATKPRLPSIVDREVAETPIQESAKPASGTVGQQRLYLILDGIRSPGRPLTASVYVTPKMSSDGRRVPVGNIAVVRQGRDYPSPGTLVFDITKAAATLQTRQLRVLVIPNAVGGEGGVPYTELQIESVRMVLE